jgi:DNA-binding cell septation regulator SpoVG
MDIKIRMTKGDWGKTKAYFDVNFVGMSLPFDLTIKGCRLVEGNNGLFVASPSIKKNDEYQNIVFFGDDTKSKVLKAALDEYNGVEEEIKEVEIDDLVEAAKNDLPF